MNKHFILLLLSGFTSLCVAQEDGLTKVTPEEAANKMKVPTNDGSVKA